MAIKQIDYYGRFEAQPADMSTARRYQALAGVAEQVGNVAMRFGEQKLKERAVKAEKEGIKAGELAGVEAVKTGKIERKEEDTIYDQSYNDALESAYLAQVSSDARNEISNILAEAPDDVQTFTELAEKAVAGIRTGVDERYLEVVDATVNNFVSTAQTKVFAAEKVKNRRMANESRLAAINAAAIDAATLARSGSMDESMASVMEAEVTIDSMMATGDLSVEKGAAKKRALRRESLEQNYKFQLDEVVEADGFSAAFKRLSELERPDDFTPDEWSTFEANAASELSRAKSIQDASEVTVTKKTVQAIKNYEKAVSLGIQVSPEQKASVANLVEGTEYQEVFNRVNKVSSFSILPTNSRIKVLQGAEESAGELVDVDDYAAILTAEKQIQQRLREDAFQFGVEQGLVDVQPFDYADPESLAMRQDQADLLSQHYNMRVSPLTEPEVSSLADSISVMTVNEKIALANTLAQSPQLWGKLDENNQKAFAMAGAIGDPNVMKAIFSGQELIKEKLAQVPSKQDYLPRVEDYIQDTYGTDDKSAIMQAAIAHYSFVQIPGEVFDGGLFEESLEAVAGTITKLNGFKTIVPRGIDEDSFENFIDNIDEEYIESIGGVSNMSNERAVDVIKQSRVFATGDNFYEVRVNGMQSLMKRDGTPLIISYTQEDASNVSARDQARKRKIREQGRANLFIKPAVL